MPMDSNRAMSPNLILSSKHLLWLVTVFFSAINFRGVECACTFPSQLRGSWVRSRDGTTLTFTSNTVAGLDVVFNGQNLGDMTCDTLSSGRYIIATAEYTATFENKFYYMCWQLVTVSDSSFILYELSDDINDAPSYAARPGSIQSSSASVDVSAACPQSSSTTLFTTLVKSGASSSDVGAACPSSVQASFTYGDCTTATLQACSDSKVLTADYGTCSTTIFGSAGGSVSCMGSAIFDGERYINLYKHDSGNDIICWKIPDTSSPGSMSTQYFSGDCSSLSGATNVDLVLGEVCPDSDSGGSGGGGDGAVIGGAVGGSLIAIAAVGVLGFLFIRKKKAKNVIGDAENGSSRKPSKVPDDHTPDPEDSKIPETTPKLPSGLPPLELNGGQASGQPLRG